jgi:hypothetical protein
MPILNVVTQQAGLVGVSPKWIYIFTNDTLEEVTTAGYLNKIVQQGNYSFSESDMALVTTKTSPSAASTQVAMLEVSYSAPNWSLVPSGSSGSVALPTVANGLIVSTNTTGALANITDLVAGNLISADAASVVEDSGIAMTNVQLKTQVKAATTANIGGAGAGPITVTAAGLTAASVVVANIETSTNAVEVQKVTAGSGNFDILFSGDPGATCTVNYIAYVAAQ